MADSQGRPETAQELRDSPAEPTQTIHPWRSVLRSSVAFAIGFIPIGTALVIALGWDSMPFFASFLAFGAAITRVMAMPVTETFLNRHMPWLSASAYAGRHRAEDKEV